MKALSLTPPGRAPVLPSGPLPALGCRRRRPYNCTVMCYIAGMGRRLSLRRQVLFPLGLPLLPPLQAYGCGRVVTVLFRPSMHAPLFCFAV